MTRKDWYAHWIGLGLVTEGRCIGAGIVKLSNLTMRGERRGITAVVRAFLSLYFVLSVKTGSSAIQSGLVTGVKGIGA